MRECAPFLERMLEADPPELRGEGDGPLARHLRSCAACARAAAVLLEETSRLDAFLAEAPAIDAERILARAGVPLVGLSRAHRSMEPPNVLGAPDASPRRRPRFPPRRVWMPLAIAAGLAALLLLRSPIARQPATSVARTPPPAPVVEPLAGQDAAIMRTNDPNITVVWLFKTG